MKQKYQSNWTVSYVLCQIKHFNMRRGAVRSRKQKKERKDVDTQHTPIGMGMGENNTEIILINAQGTV